MENRNSTQPFVMETNWRVLDVRLNVLSRISLIVNTVSRVNGTYLSSHLAYKSLPVVGGEFEYTVGGTSKILLLQKVLNSRIYSSHFVLSSLDPNFATKSSIML